MWELGFALSTLVAALFGLDGVEAATTSVVPVHWCPSRLSACLSEGETRNCFRDKLGFSDYDEVVLLEDDEQSTSIDDQFKELKAWLYERIPTTESVVLWNSSDPSFTQSSVQWAPCMKDSQAKMRYKRSTEVERAYKTVDIKELSGELFYNYRQHGFVLFTDSPKRCGSCKGFLEEEDSVWNVVTNEYKGKVPFFHFDCSHNSDVCKALEIERTPSVYYFHQTGEKTNVPLHASGSTLKTFVEAAGLTNQLDGTVFPEHDVGIEGVELLEETGEPFFLYLHDFSSMAEDFNALRVLYRSLLGYAELYGTDNKLVMERYNITTLPRLIAVRGGLPFVYPGRMVPDMHDTYKIVSWAREQKLPLAPQVHPQMTYPLRDRTYLAIACVDPSSTTSMIRDVAKVNEVARAWNIRLRAIEREQLLEGRRKWHAYVDNLKAKGYDNVPFLASRHKIPLPENKQVSFVWVNAVSWRKWLTRILGHDNVPSNQFIILDPLRVQYWDTSVDEKPLTFGDSDAVIDTVLRALSLSNGQMPKTKYTMSKTRAFFLQMLSTFAKYGSVIWIVGIVVSLLLSLRSLVWILVFSVTFLRSFYAKYITKQTFKQQ
ncbi:protein disulfide isomerase [Schizosaccharomyces japonicus yFS275]|uniref:Protein disulfide isomerase n=1 Tax=Schizosaccharomyces japonicus (strain yFS275 / FY16936) TaxID=402676 RepID=B6JXI9_SCHJY|nr:protein disulfide isomerase [Schizosaccharomyces japonicus yFS275]EEB05133.1 protein disulfide isomerase [Schizosaccharomyces japonicus yFS275]